MPETETCGCTETGCGENCCDCCKQGKCGECNNEECGAEGKVCCCKGDPKCKCPKSSESEKPAEEATS